jgi:hypothetical protein
LQDIILIYTPDYAEKHKNPDHEFRSSDPHSNGFLPESKARSMMGHRKLFDIKRWEIQMITSVTISDQL